MTPEALAAIAARNAARTQGKWLGWDCDKRAERDILHDIHARVRAMTEAANGTG